MSRLAEEGSDIDIQVSLTLDGGMRPLEAFEAMLKDVVGYDTVLRHWGGKHSGASEGIQVLEIRNYTGLRVPLICLKVFGADAQLSFQQWGKPIAIHNSALVLAYAKAVPCLFLAMAMIRRWAKERRILNAQHGFLNTYGFTLLAIYVLIQKLKIPRPTEIEKCRPREIPLGVFLRTFFTYYGNEKEHSWASPSGDVNTIYIENPNVAFTLILDGVTSQASSDEEKKHLARLVRTSITELLDVKWELTSVYVKSADAGVVSFTLYIAKTPRAAELQSRIKEEGFHMEFLEWLRRCRYSVYESVTRVTVEDGKIHVPWGSSPLSRDALIQEPCGGVPIRSKEWKRIKNYFNETYDELQKSGFVGQRLLGRHINLSYSDATHANRRNGKGGRK
eukprot:GEMP01043555.1.p1 GENE.GEMP01043555.1~~GEMP01043555.1.p1  ORF type:complete len:391 (+),score=70.58 GEMP01043555.1:558-1730(+)